MFIVFEGLDGCGKSVQQRMLIERLTAVGCTVKALAFPSKSPAGYAARQMLRLDQGKFGDDPHLRAIVVQSLMIADKYTSAPEITTARHAHIDVICSRWRDSVVVYGTAEGLDPGWIHASQALLPVPDLTILLDIPVAVALQRIRQRGQEDRYECEAFQTKVAAAYARLQSEPFCPWREQWCQEARTAWRVTIDGTGEPGVVCDHVWFTVVDLRRRLDNFDVDRRAR
jgi:dTMP kinase